MYKLCLRPTENIVCACIIFCCLLYFIHRGTQAGAIVSLVIAGYMAFQHFSRTGSLQNAFNQGSIVATLAIIFITAAACLFLI